MIRRWPAVLAFVALAAVSAFGLSQQRQAIDSNRCLTERVGALSRLISDELGEHRVSSQESHLHILRHIRAVARLAGLPLKDLRPIERVEVRDSQEVVPPPPEPEPPSCEP